MPQSIPHGLTRDYIRKALVDLDAGIDHPFGSPTRYELVHDGNHYAPKAVIGIAFQHLIGQMLLPTDFSGGEAPGKPETCVRGRRIGDCQPLARCGNYSHSRDVANPEMDGTRFTCPVRNGLPVP